MEYLHYFNHLYESLHVLKPLHLFNIGNILKSVFHLRRSSTGKDEISIFAQTLIEEDQHSFYEREGIFDDSKS